MQWLLDSWIIVALFGGMAAWHLAGYRRGGGHGCCGGGAHDHSGACCGGKKENADSATSE